MKNNDIESGFKNQDKFANDPRCPIGALRHYFTSCIGVIGLLLDEEAYSHRSVLSAEQCQEQLARGILELEKIIQRINSKELDPTDEINSETLTNFIEFLKGFVKPNKKLTLEESQAIRRKFDEMFPTR